MNLTRSTVIWDHTVKESLTGKCQKVLRWRRINASMLPQKNFPTSDKQEKQKISRNGILKSARHMGFFPTELCRAGKFLAPLGGIHQRWSWHLNLFSTDPVTPDNEPTQQKNNTQSFNWVQGVACSFSENSNKMDCVGSWEEWNQGRSFVGRNFIREIKSEGSWGQTI